MMFKSLYFGSIIRTIFALMLVALFCGFSASNASAQFYSNGTDPGSLKWFTTSTQNFKLIYPQGLDSLAREYGKSLEKWYTPVSGSIGYTPNSQYKRPTPVILHAYNATANGSVIWAPRRMDLYTVMDAFEAEPMPWIKNLAIHESRHLSQMQFAKDGILKLGHWVVGEMWTGALSGVYPNTAFLEGDAVTAETALTSSGRGRTADFLEWYRVSFDKGDMRNWYRWRYGSQKYYTPNHYTIGYVSIAGTRYTYDAPDFTHRYFERISHGFPIRFNNFKKTIKEYSNASFKKSFNEISSSFQNIWTEEDKHRLSPIEVSRITQEPKRFTVYLKGTFAGDNLYAIKSSLTQTSTLVRISSDGNEESVRPFSSSTSKLSFSPTLQRLFWSENIKDARWDLSMQSIIRFINIDDNKIYNLTAEGRLYNPSISPDGLKLCAVEYPIKGGNNIVIVNATTGDILSKINSPEDDIQLVELAWPNDDIYASGISDEGYGIYKFSDGKWTITLNPTTAKIKNLQAYKDGISFTCDMSGVNEIYSLSNDNLCQLTATKYGASDFTIKGNELFFANLDSDGKAIVKATINPVAEHLAYTAHTYPIADKLSEQEKKIGTSTSFHEASFTDVKRYRKVPNLPHIHSWSPIFFDSNNINNISFDQIYQTSGLGATLLFQNELSTFQGSLGYSYHQDNLNPDTWKNTVYLNLLYEGLYPVIEFKGAFNDGDITHYSWKEVISNDDVAFSIKGTHLSQPSISGDLKIYVPLSFNNGGWLRGLIPQIAYSFTNNVLNTSKVIMNNSNNLSIGGYQRFMDYEEGKAVIMHNATASLRGYIVKPVTNSAIYPKLGIGLEIGYKSRLGVNSIFNSNAYAYSYGYLPGLLPSHSIKVTAIAQQQFGKGLYRENAIKTIPRGFADSALSLYLGKNEKTQTKATIDYAMPILPVDWTFLCPLFYIRNFELIPHADIAKTSKGNLYSVGSDFNVHLGNFLWLPYDTTMGISIDINGGSAYNALNGIVADLSKSYVGFNMNINL